MSTLRVAVAGLGWPGMAHARGYREAGGFKVVAVADRIPGRVQAAMSEFEGVRVASEAAELVRDPQVDVISICTPTDTHLEIATAALKAGKHVVCETPPAATLKDARRLAAAAERAGKVLLLANQRRFGPGELAARQAIEKGYIGDPYHVRATWLRSRAVPVGTGWYGKRDRAGGGALIDLGLPMFDVAWWLMGEPTPASVYAVSHRGHITDALPPEAKNYDVDECGFALIKFDDHRTLELGAAWVINQPPAQNGTVCRVHATAGAIEVYTPAGAVLYRPAGGKAQMRETPLKVPRTIHHAALMRHLRAAIAGETTPAPGPSAAVTWMAVIEALYRSLDTGRSVEVKR